MKNRNKRTPSPKDSIICNERIRAREVRVDGEVMDKQQALYEAQDKNMDLILVNDKATPPVCRIMELNKYLYEQKQREKAAKKKQREAAVETKEIRFGLNIDVGDIEVKCNNIRKMLNKNCKVTLTVTLKGRERSRTDLAEELLRKFAVKLEVELEDISKSGNRVSAKIA